MNPDYTRRASGFRKASRLIGYGGFVLAALVAGVWFLVEMVINKKTYASFDKVLVGKFATLPVIPFYAALAALILIGIAIILRIIAAATAGRAKKEAAEEPISGAKDFLRKATEKLPFDADAISQKATAAAEKIKSTASVVRDFCKEHAVVLIPGVCSVLTLGFLLKKEKRRNRRRR